MVNLTKKERIDLIISVAMEYVLTPKSMRGVAKEFGMCKTTVHSWLSKQLPVIDPQLSKIVQRKIALYKKQKYTFALTPTDIKTLKAKKRRQYVR